MKGSCKKKIIFWRRFLQRISLAQTVARIHIVASQQEHLHLERQSRTISRALESSSTHARLTRAVTWCWKQQLQCLLIHYFSVEITFTLWGCISWCISTAANIFTLQPSPWMRRAGCIEVVAMLHKEMLCGDSHQDCSTLQSLQRPMCDSHQD